MCVMSDSRLCHNLQYGDTALHKAADNGHLEIATLLINNGCDVNITYNIVFNNLSLACV